MSQTMNLRAQILAFLPDLSLTRFSRVFQLNRRTVERWMGGGYIEVDSVDNPLPDGLREKVEQQIAAFKAVKLDERIASMISEMQEAGLEDEVIAAWFAKGYSDLVGRSVD